MSFFEELAVGIMGSLRANGSPDRESGRIERLCRELGWSVDERDGDMISLHFKDALAGIRKVLISHGDESLVLLAAYSFAILPASKAPQEIAGHLLSRNSEMRLGAWQVSLNRDGELMFNVRYVACGRGLTAGLLKFICDGLVRETAEFDRRMAKAGLLRA